MRTGATNSGLSQITSQIAHFSPQMKTDRGRQLEACLGLSWSRSARDVSGPLGSTHPSSRLYGLYPTAASCFAASLEDPGPPCRLHGEVHPGPLSAGCTVRSTLGLSAGCTVRRTLGLSEGCTVRSTLGLIAGCTVRKLSPAGYDSTYYETSYLRTTLHNYGSFFFIHIAQHYIRFYAI